MSSPKPKQRRPVQIVQTIGQMPQLPDGVNAQDWIRERDQAQNPRIRTYLDCIGKLEGLLLGNYAILHCSPLRFRELWSQLLELADELSEQLAPLVERFSPVPSLEEACNNSAIALRVLKQTTLHSLQRSLGELSVEELIPFRKQACVAIGQIQDFLRDTFGLLMASDPRAQHDADYYLSKRFGRDVDEVKWLHSSVRELDELLQDLASARTTVLRNIKETMLRKHVLPGDKSWQGMNEFLARLDRELVPKLRMILGLRGIRFDESETLDSTANRIVARSRALVEIRDAGHEGLQRLFQGRPTGGPQEEQCKRDMLELNAVFCRRITDQISLLDQTLRDLGAFVPVWAANIERRRSFLR